MTMNDNVVTNLEGVAPEQVAPQLQQPQQSPALKLQLNLDEVNVLLAGLGELPAKISLPMIEKVRGQVMVQLQQNPQG